MLRIIPGFLIAAATISANPSPHMTMQGSQPERPAVEGCAWLHVSDANVGLAAWVQECDFGDRRISLFLKPGGLAIRHFDGGAAEPLVDVFDLLPGERIEAGMQRVYRSHTDPALAERCVLAKYADGAPVSGVHRFVVEPDAAYRKELVAHADPDGVPEPPCGDMGIAPDGIQYFEARPDGKVRKLLFVRVGQDEPLFDERRLEPIDAITSVEASANDGCCRYRPGPGGIDADFLLETCSVTGKTAHGMVPHFDCQSYVLAVLDSYKVMQGVLPKSRRACLPSDLTTRAVLDAMMTQYVYERDAKRRAAEVILDTLQVAYACTK